MLRALIPITLALTVALAPFANAVPDGSSSMHASNRPVTKIVVSGLAGAILGLSTLSFYGRPQDNLNNIAIGFAVGIIGGTIFTTYQVATEPKEFYGGAERAVDRWALLENPRYARAPAGLLAYDLTF